MLTIMVEFLTKEVVNISHTKWIYATDKGIAPESSSMPFDAARKRGQKPFVRTVDTYIMVLAIAYMERVSVQGLWIAFGTGKKV